MDKLQEAEAKQTEIDFAVEDERDAKEALAQKRKIRESLQCDLGDILRVEGSPLFEQPSEESDESIVTEVTQ